MPGKPPLFLGKQLTVQSESDKQRIVEVVPIDTNPGIHTAVEGSAEGSPVMTAVRD